MRPWFYRFDPLLCVPALLLSLFGILTMRTPDLASIYFEKQSMWVALGCGVLLISSALQYRFLRTTSATLVVYAGVIVLLVATLLFGSTIKGTRGWIHLGAFSLQAADLAKAATVLVLAKYFSRRHVEIRQWRHVFISGAYVGLLMVCILMQPDFGSAMVLAMVWGAMVLASGIPWSRVAVLLCVAAFIFTCMWMYVFEPYQKARLATFFNPTADIRGRGYNVYQATIAVGSGGLWGKGVGQGTQSKLEFLPEYHTDFIFAAFAEEWGYVGFCTVLLLFGVLVWRLLHVARLGSSNFEALLAVGVASLIALEVTVNIGMNIGLLPVTGIALPFMSYGGSHLLVEFLLIGVVIGMRQRERVVRNDSRLHDGVDV